MPRRAWLTKDLRNRLGVRLRRLHKPRAANAQRLQGGCKAVRAARRRGRPRHKLGQGARHAVRVRQGPTAKLRRRVFHAGLGLRRGVCRGGRRPRLLAQQLQQAALGLGLRAEVGAQEGTRRGKGVGWVGRQLGDWHRTEAPHTCI